MRRLTEDEFKATTVAEAERVGLDEEPPFDFWEYFEAIPREDFGEHDFFNCESTRKVRHRVATADPEVAVSACAFGDEATSADPGVASARIALTLQHGASATAASSGNFRCLVSRASGNWHGQHHGLVA